MTLRLSRGGARTQINLSDLIFSYLRRELQRKARELKSSTIDVANGTNSNGKVVRSARQELHQGDCHGAAHRAGDETDDQP
jgi:hypothetical protein